MPTKPKRNAEFRAKPEGLRIFIKSLNLMDLALDRKKEKAKPARTEKARSGGQKAPARRPDGNEKFPCLPYLP